MKGELKLARVKYMDHVLFRNSDPYLLKPSMREAIGWVIKETDEALWICFDKAYESQSFEKLDPSSGLIILKSDILEVKEIG